MYPVDSLTISEINVYYYDSIIEMAHYKTMGDYYFMIHLSMLGLISLSQYFRVICVDIHHYETIGEHWDSIWQCFSLNVWNN